MQLKKLHVEMFDVNVLKKESNIMITGSNNTSITNVTLDLMNYLNNIHNGIIFTRNNAYTYKKFFPHIYTKK